MDAATRRLPHHCVQALLISARQISARLRKSPKRRYLEVNAAGGAAAPAPSAAVAPLCRCPNQGGRSAPPERAFLDRRLVPLDRMLRVGEPVGLDDRRPRGGLGEEHEAAANGLHISPDAPEHELL